MSLIKIGAKMEQCKLISIFVLVLQSMMIHPSYSYIVYSRSSPYQNEPLGMNSVEESGYGYPQVWPTLNYPAYYNMKPSPTHFKITKPPPEPTESTFTGDIIADRGSLQERLNSEHPSYTKHKVPMEMPAVGSIFFRHPHEHDGYKGW